MDIQIQETPSVELGDLVFVDDMMRGRQFQVARADLKVQVGKDLQSHKAVLYDIPNAGIYKTFINLDFLQRYLNTISHSVRSQKDYQISLRKK